MEPFVWRDRLVKLLDDKTWALSAKGDHGDWDFSRGWAGAMAGGFPPYTIYDAEWVDQGRLAFHTTGGTYTLHGDDEKAYISGP